MKTPEEWSRAANAMHKRHDAEQRAMTRERDDVVFPSLQELRPATAADIVVGAIIYYPDKENPYWHIIDEVMRPSDDFKAFCADDGCRYGLDGAFVKNPPRKGKK